MLRLQPGLRVGRSCRPCPSNAFVDCEYFDVVQQKYIKMLGILQEELAGRNMLFGIREHAMGAIVNGIGYYGIFQCREQLLQCSSLYESFIRLSALTNLPIFHIWTRFWQL